MQVNRYTRKQRRHNYFVLECNGKYLKFAEDGNSYGFVEMKQDPNVFRYEKAKAIQDVVTQFSLNIQLLVKVNGKTTAL